MTGNQALLTVHELQTRYWGIQESRSAKFARQARELLDLEATIIHCPDCDNGYVRDKSCHCSPNPAGCPDYRIYA